MPSPILHVQPEEIDNAEKRRKFTVCIIGYGRIGIFHAYLFAESGFKVKCVDEDQTVVNSVARGKISFLSHEVTKKLENYLKTGLLSATSDVKTAVSQSDVIVITVPVQFDAKRKANYSNLEKTCKLVGANLYCGSMVIVVSTVGVGTIQGLIKEILENASGFKVGTDFGLAYSPIQLSNMHTLEGFANQERIVAADDKHSSVAASSILGTIVKNLRKTADVKTAEAVTLFEAVRQDVNEALAKELALFCERSGLDYLEASKIAGSDTCLNSSLPILTNDNTCEELCLFLEDTENLNLKLRMPTIAREINDQTARCAVNLTKDALKNCGKALRRARISILGISQTPNMQDSPKKIVEKLGKMLEARGGRINFYDPYISSHESTEIQGNLKKTLTEALERADCIVIVTGHEQFKRLNLKKLKAVVRMPAAIVDLEGIVEPKKAEEEGFIFRGLGRGVWSK